MYRQFKMNVGYSLNVMYITLVLKGCLWKFAENFEWQECDGRLYHFSTSNMTYFASMTQCFYVIKVSHMENLSTSSLANERRIAKACGQLTIPNRQYYWTESLSNTANKPGQCQKMQKIGDRCYFTLESCTSFAHPLCETITTSTTPLPHPLQANLLLRGAMSTSRLKNDCSDLTYVVPTERAMYYSEANQFCQSNYDSSQIEFGNADETFISKYLQNCIAKLQKELPYWVGLCRIIHLEKASIKKEKLDACFEKKEKNRAFPICSLRNNLGPGLRTDVTNPTTTTKIATIKTLIGAGSVNTQPSLHNRWFYITSAHQFYLSNQNADFDSCESFCASMEGSRLAVNPLALLQNTLDKHERYWANDNAASFSKITNRVCSLLISCPEESTGCSHVRFTQFPVTCSTEAHCICERVDFGKTKPVLTSATTKSTTVLAATTHKTPTSTADTQTTTTTSTSPRITPATTTSTNSTKTKTSTFTIPITTTSNTATHTTAATSNIHTSPTVTFSTLTRTTASTTPATTTRTTTSTPETITATPIAKAAAKMTTAEIRPAGTREITPRSAVTTATRPFTSGLATSSETKARTDLKEATATTAVPISHEGFSEKHTIGQQEYFICYRKQNYSESRENCHKTFNGSLATFPGSLMYFTVMEQLNLKNGSFWIGVLNTNNDPTSGCLTFDKSHTGKAMSTTKCESKHFSVCSRAIYTHEDLQKEVLENAAFKEILKDMTVDRRDTILSKRKVSSAEDKRQTSKTLGAVSAFVLCLLVSIIVLIDMPRLRNLFIALKANGKKNKRGRC